MTTTYTVRHALKADALYISPRLRPEDRNEILAASGKEPRDILPACVDGRTYLFSGNCFPIALFGVNDIGEGIGVPWMVATPRLVCHQRHFIRHCHEWVDRISEGFTLLTNCVDARNTLHLKWIQWAGFTITHLHEEWGHAKLPFYQFERRPSCVIPSV